MARVLVRAGQHVRGLIRRADQHATLPKDVEGVVGDLNQPETLSTALVGVQGVFQMSADMPPDYVDAFFSFFVEGKLDESQVLSTVQDLTGKPPRTFEQWASAHADAF